jgi:phospholipase C
MISRYFAAAALLALFACARSAGVPPVALPQTQADLVALHMASPIKHVVFVVQENRSFNNLFLGFPGATTQDYGYDERGRKIQVRPQDLGAPWDLGHNAASFFAACDGTGKLPGTHCKMDGWNRQNNSPNTPKNGAYSYVPRSQIKPYWTIAGEYVLSDRTFASNLDGSFVAHQYVVAAYASSAVDYPVGPWGCEGGQSDTVTTLTQYRTIGASINPCFTNPTIGGEADRHGVSWRFYAGTINGDGGIWSSYQADAKIYRGADWTTDVINPPAQFLSDVKHGKLASITWIAPTFETSDHPPNETQGPAWIASLVNAVGESRFWDSTAVLIVWDDWGGFFDPVRPVYKDYDGLGFRVPLLMVSAYAKRGYVTHVQYETASVLRYIEDNFGLPQLAPSDRRAKDPAGDAFDYSQQPRKFKPIPGGKPAAYWLQTQRALRDERRPPGMLGDD